jgi:dihydroorotate dehydrogenase electron transfer subunit
VTSPPPSPDGRDPPILLEDARVLGHEKRPGGQGILTLLAPDIAARARPGTFVHLRCDPLLPMRRPMSVMGANEGRIEILYKITGRGTELLARVPTGATLSLLGPIGRPFRPDPIRPRKFLVGGGVGLPPVLFLTETLVRAGHEPSLLTLLYGSELPFPLDARTTGGAAAVLARAQALGVSSALASRTLQLSGVHRGHVTELLESRLADLTPEERTRTEVAACGPGPMLAEVQRLCRLHGVRGELCLEELMACAVGGCGGCAVAVRDGDGLAMKRVCVDGPVFAADAVVLAG